MVDKISREQYKELCHSKMWDSQEDFNKKLEETTGIVAKRYVAYQYFDSADNYIGCSENHTVKDLIINAFIEIEGDATLIY